MTNMQTTIVGGFSLVVVLMVFGGWLLFFSVPGTIDIDVKRQPPQPIPSISIQTLGNQLAELQLHGNLPINLNDAGLGREDPFANR